MSVDYEPYSHRHREDPYPVYRELRDHAPLHYAPQSDAYVVSRFEDVVLVLKTPQVFSSKRTRAQEAQQFRNMGVFERVRTVIRFMGSMRAWPTVMSRSRMLIQEDGDVHAVMRNIVNRGFTPGRIAAWEKRVRELAGEALARMRAQPQFDLVQELTIPLPVTVIAEMLGVESARMADFKRWSDAVIQAGTGSGMGTFGSGKGFQAMKELRQYLHPIVRARRAEPADDLISLLVTAEGDTILNDFEIFLFVLLLLVAGNETTTNLLGNATDALLQHPEELARVVDDQGLVPGLVEETLRWESPVQFINRTTVQPTEMHGVSIPEGASVVVLLASANRDERQFEDPDRFDVTRSARGHVGLGFGAHFCLGAALARLESKGALEVLVPELPGLVRVRTEREFLDSYLIRGRARLELREAA